MSGCIVCKKKSRYTINRGTESEVKLCSNHYTNQINMLLSINPYRKVY